jgi:hypothetical protein
MAHHKKISSTVIKITARAASISLIPLSNLILTVLVLLLNACSDYRREPDYTAERLKNVQARQAT